jgi:E3 ubiquitin-protein ligase listerin
LEPSEKIDLLNRWIRIPKIQKSWLIMRALSYPLCCDGGITKFLKMKEVTDYLAECAVQVSNGFYKDNLIILQKCFFQTENGDILIDNLTCSNIVDIMCSTLKDTNKLGQIDQCASFLAQIFSTICSDPDKKDIQIRIFLNLFDCSVTKEVDDNLSEDTMWEVSTAWQDALSSGDLEMNDELLEFCSEIINERLSNLSMISTSIEDVERFSELIAKLIMCSNEDKQGSERDEAINRMANVLLDHEKYNSYLMDISSSIESIRGEYTFDTKKVIDTGELINFTDALDIQLKHKIFNLNIILMLSCNVKRKVVQEVPINDESDEDEIEYSEMKKQEIQEEEITEDYCDLSENLLKEWKGIILEKFLDIALCDSILNTLLMHTKKINSELENWIFYMQERLKILLENVSDSIQHEIKNEIFEKTMTIGGLYIKCLPLLLHTKGYNNENGKVLLFEDVSQVTDESSLAYINLLQTFEKVLNKKSMSITPNVAEKCFNYLHKPAAASVFIKNHLDIADFNEMTDKRVVGHGLILMHEIITKNKENPFLLYNKDVSLESPKDVLTVAAIANFISECLLHFPTEVDIRRWDFIRIALSSWILSVSKSCEKFNDEIVKNFIVSIFRLNASLQRFIIAEKTKSSTEALSNMIDEWENVFAKDVNLVLIKSFIYIVKNIGK